MIDREARDLAVSAAQFGEALKATDILVLQVGDVLAVTEYFVVMSGSNRRLVDALVEEIEARVREQTGRSPVRVEGARENQWVLIDYGDVVVHVFLSEIREFYEIERLYTDVPKIDWAGDGSEQRPGDGAADAVEPTGTE